MSDSSIIEARLSVLEHKLSEIQSRLQKTEPTQPFKIEAGIVYIEEAPIKDAAINAVSDECIPANREAIVENAVRIANTLGMNTDAYKAKDDDAVSHAEKYDELHSWKIKADECIAAARDAIVKNATRSKHGGFLSSGMNAVNAHVGKYDETQLWKMALRRDEILNSIADYLTPRRGSPCWGRDFDIHQMGRVLGLMQAVVEIQALIEVNERGLEAKEKILEELNHPRV